MYPWLPFWNLWRFPLSGNVGDIAPVTDWFSPHINVFAGNAPLEAEINANVASYGKQLGIITEAVLELSTGKPGPAVKRLKDLAAEIEKAKDDHKTRAVTQAETTLQGLKRDDPKAFKDVMGRLEA